MFSESNYNLSFSLLKVNMFTFYATCRTYMFYAKINFTEFNGAYPQVNGHRTVALGSLVKLRE